MNEMVHTVIVDISDDSTKFCVAWVLCWVSQYGLKTFVNSWNHHTIPSTFLLICRKILIKRNPTSLLVFETKFFVLHFCTQCVTDNGVLGFTRKTCFSKFNPADIEHLTLIQHSSRTNKVLWMLKQCCVTAGNTFLIYSYFHSARVMIFRCEFL